VRLCTLHFALLQELQLTTAGLVVTLLTLPISPGTPYFICTPPDASANASTTGAFCGSLVDKNNGNKTFVLASIHFHAPSENTLDGKSYPEEMHMVGKYEHDKLTRLNVRAHPESKYYLPSSVALTALCPCSSANELS